MNIAYLIWLENLSSPILKGQVTEVLGRITKMSPEDKIYLFSFQPIDIILLHYQEIYKLRKAVMSNKINLIFIPSLTTPEFNWFNAKWYIIPFIFLQTFPILLFLAFIKKIEILHCRSYPIMLAAIMVKKIKKELKIIFDPRSPFPEENITANKWTERSFTYKLWKKLEKLYLNKSDITIAITNTYIEHFAKISSSSSFVIIPNNVDTTKFIPNKEFREYHRSKMEISDDEIIFAYSGSLGNHWNNPKVYAKFIIKLRKLNIKHRFLFLTPNVRKLNKIFYQYGIRTDEYFTISVDLNDVPKYLTTADLGLNLMENEDIRMSIKTAEYLSMGLPMIINSNVLGAKEIVEQYDVGLILEELENINLKKIENFVQKKEQFSLKCRKVACEKFSTEMVAMQYIKAYENLKHNVYSK